MKKHFFCLVQVCFLFILLLVSCTKGADNTSFKVHVTGPVETTSESYPFNSAYHTVVPQDLKPYGYVEEEYIISGRANVYDYDSTGNVVVKIPDAPYTTRILIRRPADKARFSGNVVLELNNPTSKFDMDLQWMFCRDFFMENNDIWVGVTVKPVALKALQMFNRERYKSLSMDNPAPPEQRCAIIPSSLNDTTQETENGLVWDIVSQAGRLLRSQEESNPLKDYHVKYVIATGYSQTGGYLTTYINLIHPLESARLADGRPIFDGYMIGDGDAFMAPINQCADWLPPGETGVTVKPCDVPVISVVTQGLLNSTIAARRPDSDTSKDRYRRYEIPGSSHINKKSMDNSPNSDDTVKSGVPASSSNCEGVDKYGVTDFPIEFFMNSAYWNLYDWIRNGTPPPKAGPVITETADGNEGINIKLDEHGNALGGVRHPYVEVPVATWHDKSMPLNSESMFFCSLAGYRVPFDREKIRTLYSSKEDYVKKVDEITDKLMAERFLTRSDGERIKQQARGINVW